MCRLTTTNSTNISSKEETHLFYQDLTTEFHHSCSCFLLQENACPPSPRRRLFQDDNNDNGTILNMVVNKSNNGDTNTNNLYDDDDDMKNIEVPFLNLLPEKSGTDQEEKREEYETGDIVVLDPWMKDALGLSMIIQQHSKLLHECYNLYTNQYLLLLSRSDDHSSSNQTTMTMSNEELHNFESQLVSFMASTTKNIEHLRQINNVNASNGQSNATIYHHRNGIIANLFSELKVVMNAYADMQSIRHRHSLMILENPFKVSFYPAGGGGNTGASSSNSRRSRSGVPKEGSDENDDISYIQLEPLPVFNYNNKKKEEEGYENEIATNEEMEEFSSRYNYDDSDEFLMKVLNEPLPSLPPKMTPQQKLHLERKMMMNEEESTNYELPMIDEEEEVEEVEEETQALLNKERLSHHETMTDVIKSKDLIRTKEKSPLRPLDKSTLKSNHHSSSSTTRSTTPAFEYDTSNNSSSSSSSISNSNNQDHQHQLEQETALLANKIQNESLDSVQKVETQMIQITSLLNQFTSLINDQQVEINVIHENTLKSKDNVEKGSEQLLQAKESKRGSRHYFAWIIVLLGFALLFFNSVLP